MGNSTIIARTRAPRRAEFSPCPRDTFTSGQFRDPANGLPAGASGDTFFVLGPGFRWAVGDRIDAGFGMQFATSNGPLAGQLYRTELRWRF